MRRKSKVNEVTTWETWGKFYLLFEPGLLFVGLISFRVECIVGRFWRARCLDPRGATTSSRLGFDCAKVISVSGKSTLVSEKIAVGIGKRGPEDTPVSFYSTEKLFIERNFLFIAISIPRRANYFPSSTKIWLPVKSGSVIETNRLTSGFIIFISLKKN